MINHSMRSSSEAPLPLSATVVVVVSCATRLALPATKRLAVVGSGPMISTTSGAAISSTVVGGAVAGGAVVAGASVGGDGGGGGGAAAWVVDVDGGGRVVVVVVVGQCGGGSGSVVGCCTASAPAGDAPAVTGSAWSEPNSRPKARANAVSAAIARRLRGSPPPVDGARSLICSHLVRASAHKRSYPASRVAT